MADLGPDPPEGVGQSSTTAGGRFILDESDQDAARPAQWLRDWWWSGTRTQRWTAAIGAPLAVILLAGTFTALADDNPDQQAAATTTTIGRPTAETSSESLPTHTSAQTATVTTILSGDTIVVSRDSGTETVRLIGIDAPEVSGSSAGQQCWATESTQFASDTLLQQQVRLTADPTQGDVDDTGATLAYVVLPDGRDVSVVLAGAGQARSYSEAEPATKTAEITAAEQAARTALLGLWGEPCHGRVSAPVPTVEPTPTTTAPPPPPPPEVTDPRFANCLQARARGFGPYVAGVDPEYSWYTDKDGDGIACERLGER